jgi:Concanavalin A-like lectin/glucanases superfamily
MDHSIIFAAPLLIAAVVMATRFVGCSLAESGTASPQPYSSLLLPMPPLVSLWRLNETSTSSPALDSKDGNGGTYQNVTGVALGVAGLANTDTPNTAARFDGGSGSPTVNGGYVSAKYDPSLNPPAFTVEALVNPSAIGVTTDPTDYHAIVSSRHINASPVQTFGYILYLHHSGFEAWIGDGSANFVTIQVAAGAVVNGGLYYVAMTYDGAKLKLYVNPTDTQAELLTAPQQYAEITALTYKPNTVNELRIGAGDNDHPATYCFPGEIQDVAIYNAALAFTDIQSHFSVAMTGFST